MKVLISILTILLAADTVCADVPILISDKPTQIEQIAAGEFRYYLGALYRRDRFVVSVGDAEDDSEQVIRIGTPESAPELLKYLGEKKLNGAESYIVTHAMIKGKDTGIIFGADPSGVMYGVYGVLKKLGFGFYLTEDTFVKPTKEAFNFNAWDFVNRPLVKERIIFNWHNFLTGCTGWDYKNWQDWVIQSQKMGYNTVMVHAYGNNPMFTFSFNGIEKEVGYVATSKRGRDWGNEHVNDVRRLPGGWIFDKAEFGSEAAMVPDDKRVESIQGMMKKVFALAEKRGMKICFDLDVDTRSVLQQDMILTLDEKDRFYNGGVWLPRPDTKGGRAYYRAQVEGLLKLYPEIDTIGLWRRGNGAEWGRLKRPEQLPAEWQVEYNAHLKRNPEAGKIQQAVCAFALNKVAGAFRGALDEMGRGDVGLAMGSWNENWIASLVEFLDKDVTIIPLDWGSLKRYSNGSFFRNAGKFETVKAAAGRVVPIIWAQHDDGEYVGRPLDCHKNFSDSLSKLGAKGFGVIHWMTRPLDLYFVNHSNQVWSATKNETVRKTCDDMALHFFGESQHAHLSECLYRWATEAPIYGRVTTDHFFYKNQCVDDPEQTLKKCQDRFEAISNNKTDIFEMTTVQRARLGYFRQLERMNMNICKMQEFVYRPAMKALQEGDYAGARKLLAGADYENSFFWFSYMAQANGGNRGDEALVVSLGTRWLTDYLAACQAAGCEGIRINYGPTSFEELAQNGGRYTYYIDPKGKYWSVRGEKETKRPAVDYSAIKVAAPEDASATVKEIVETGIVIDKPTSLKLSPMVDLHKKIAPGEYRLVVYAGCGSGQKEARVRFNVEGAQGAAWVKEKSFYPSYECSGTAVRVYGIEDSFIMKEAGMPELKVVPEKGSAVVFGVKLERVEK